VVPSFGCCSWENSRTKKVGAAAHCPAKENIPITRKVDVVLYQPHVTVAFQPKVKKCRKTSQVNEAIVERASTLFFFAVSSRKRSLTIHRANDEIRWGRRSKGRWSVKAEKGIEPGLGLPSETLEMTQDSPVHKMRQKYDGLHELQIAHLINLKSIRNIDWKSIRTKRRAGACTLGREHFTSLVSNGMRREPKIAIALTMSLLR
jgi:hypothetical protein